MKKLLAIWLLVVSAAPLVAQFPASQALPGDRATLPSAGSQQNPSIAWQGDGYLAVWEDGRSALAGSVANPDGLHANRDVYGVRLDAQGQWAGGPPIVICQQPWDQVHTRVAWNGSMHLVVFESTRPTQFYRTQGVYAVRVDASGAVLDDPPIVIDDDDDEDERFPVVASDGNGWIVAFSDALGGVGQELRGAYVDASGLVLSQRTLVPSTQPMPSNYEVAFAGGRLGVTYERNYASQIGLRLFDTALLPSGPEITVTTNGLKPGIGSSGSEFYVAWIAGGAHGTPVSAGGVIAQPGGVALDSGQATLAVAPAWNGSGWSIAFGGYGAMHDAEVDAAGNALPSSPITLTNGNFYSEDPAIAGGSDRAVAVWSHAVGQPPHHIDPFDVHAGILGPSAAGGSQPITLSVPAQVYPAIAGDSVHGYLVAFQSRSSGAVRILAQRVSVTGSPIDVEPIEVALGDASIGGVMDVGFDGNHWLVVYSRVMPGGPPYLYRSFARRVALDGSLPDPAPIDLMTGTTPHTAAIQGQFLVVTNFHYSPTQSNAVFHYKRVRGSDGAVLDANEVPITLASGSSDLIAFDDRWLLAFGAVRGVFILADGTPQTPFYAADAGNGSTGVVHPALALNGDEALLVWEFNASLPWNSDLRARRIRKDGTLLDAPTGSFVSSANNAQFLPCAAWFGAKYLVAFTDYRDHAPIEPGIGDVYAVRVDASNVVLDTTEIPAENRWPAAEGRSAIAGEGGRALMIHGVLDGGADGNWRLHRQTHYEAAAPLAYCTAKTNALGCVPQISTQGIPDASATSGFFVRCTQVRNQKLGLLLYSKTGRAATPFQGGTLCLNPPLKRGIGLSSAGNPPPASDCSGSYQFDMNAFAHGLLGGNPDPALRVPGTVIGAQWWGRDPGFPPPNNSMLSAAVEYSL